MLISINNISKGNNDFNVKDYLQTNFNFEDLLSVYCSKNHSPDIIDTEINIDEGEKNTVFQEIAPIFLNLQTILPQVEEAIQISSPITSSPVLPDLQRPFSQSPADDNVNSARISLVEDDFKQPKEQLCYERENREFNKSLVIPIDQSKQSEISRPTLFKNFCTKEILDNEIVSTPPVQPIIFGNTCQSMDQLFRLNDSFVTSTNSYADSHLNMLEVMDYLETVDQNGEKEVSFYLEPENLGRLSVMLKLNDSRVITIASNSQTTVALLKQDVNLLHNSLANIGFENSEVIVIQKFSNENSSQQDGTDDKKKYRLYPSCFRKKSTTLDLII